MTYDGCNLSLVSSDPNSVTMPAKFYEQNGYLFISIDEPDVQLHETWLDCGGGTVESWPNLPAVITPVHNCMGVPPEPSHVGLTVVGAIVNSAEPGRVQTAPLTTCQNLGISVTTAGELTGTDADTDQDGISDRDEDALGTDKYDPDTDGDFLQDGYEMSLGTDPLDRDSDDGGVRDDREVLIDHSDPTSAADDVPLDYKIYWQALANKAASDYKSAKKYGDATKGYYHQVLNLVCSASGVSVSRPASASAMKKCASMRRAVGAPYGRWAGDFPWEVFRSFLPTVDSDEIKANGKKAQRLGEALCLMAASSLGPIAGVQCHRHLDDIGFSVAGTVHATHHLYPNFVKHAERITESAAGGLYLQLGILRGNLKVMRHQHHLLFSNAVVPGFDAVNEVSGVYKWIAKKFVPFAASCERERAIREGVRDVLGKSRGDQVYAKVSTSDDESTVSSKKCGLWMKASHLL